MGTPARRHVGRDGSARPTVGESSNLAALYLAIAAAPRCYPAWRLGAELISLRRSVTILVWSAAQGCVAGVGCEIPPLTTVEMRSFFRHRLTTQLNLGQFFCSKHLRRPAHWHNSRSARWSHPAPNNSGSGALSPSRSYGHCVNASR